ncbi:MAG TPA: hypothetical protein VFG03_02145, partial [Telluria sp.]|nr:hypothetical protein [Telluria sp.]
AQRGDFREALGDHVLAARPQEVLAAAPHQLGADAVVLPLDLPVAERKLVPFAKAYSGLTDAEIALVDNAIRKTTIEKFGPVRSVRPTMVFEIGFEGIALSSRHKAGIAVRFPRILRKRDDKSIDDADTLDTLKGLLASAGP